MHHENLKKFGSVISRLISKENLTRKEAKEMFTQMLLNQQPDIQQGAFLAALKSKGETAEEIAGSWEAIYELDTVKVTPDTDRPLVENCGTGMDTLKTFNISTAASIIAAAAGVVMAKHGARAITSTCGTIDILEALGVDVECEPHIVKKSIEKAGIGIFNGMSPKVHPQALGRILSQISFGTTLNIAASLANPALPCHGVRGVYAKELVEPVARVMREIGYKKALVIHGLDQEGSQGMDEASTIGETHVAELTENGQITRYSLRPEDFGIKPADKHFLAPSTDLEKESLLFVQLLSGQQNGPRTDIVCLNSALVLYLMNISVNIKDGYEKSKEILFSGMAMKKLREWVAEQNTEPEKGLAKLDNTVKKVLN